MTSARWMSGVAFLLSFALYSFTLGVRSDGQLLGNDAMPYAAQLVAGTPAGLWNAHHLLFHPLVLALARLREWLGGPFDELAVLEAQRLVSALGGAGCVTLVFGFGRRFIGSVAAALLAVCFAASYGNWLLASVGETYAPASCVTAWLLVRAAEMRLGVREPNVPRLALLLLTAVLLRQDAVLVVVALPFLIPLRAAFATAAFAGFTSVALYALAWAASGVEASFGAWLRGLAGSGTWGNAPGAGDFGLSAGLTATAVHYGLVPLRRVFGGRLDELGEAPLLSALAAFAALALALLPLRRPNGPRASVALGLAVFALVRWVFFTWWEPGNIEHHTGTLVPLFLLAVLVLPGHRPGARRIAALAAAALLVAIGNYAIAFGPNRVTTNSAYARSAGELAGDDGRVVALGAFAWHALLREPPERARTVDATGVLMRGDERALPELEREVRETRARGGSVVLFRAIGIWPRLLLVEPPLDLQRLDRLTAGATTTTHADEDGDIWAVVLE